jgi:hypothetical protein
MPVENTDLERRVLAHEQILQLLMAQLADGRPMFLDRLNERFASVRRGAYQHDYVETADYAEAFLHEVARLVRTGFRPARALANLGEPAASDPVMPKQDAVMIHTARVHGVWHVTRDGAFVGDYLAEAPALAAAALAAREVERLGRRAEILFGPNG